MRADIELRNKRAERDAELLNAQSLYKTAESAPVEEAHLWKIQALLTEMWAEELEEQINDMEERLNERRD